MEEVNYQKVKEIATNLLDSFDIAEPIVPVAEIAQRKGLELKYFKPDSDENLKKVSGFFNEKTKTIYINSEDPPRRQSFTIAHELGHYILQHQPNQVGVLYRYATPIDKEDPLEQEANYFAANLLVPEDMLTKVMKKYNLTENDGSLLADIFGVSLDVIKYRLPWISN